MIYRSLHSMSNPTIGIFIIITTISTINKVITINSNLLLLLPLRLLLAILLPIVTVIASHDPSTSTATYSSSSQSSSIITTATNSTTNILFILADDLGYGDLSVFPYNRLQCSKTPHLQAMADRGVYIVMITMMVMLCSFTCVWYICNHLLLYYYDPLLII